ncbi:hypothetical protein DDZ15_08270 [Rhodohalobacter mucosus]|uniref:Uncharacterized protein n=1 Tax=Rhodohalobacter mucosus TaxID=2079485 RepID=A0A316TPI0_9BACT|nr:hypothetical protein DDZ15_08270 [Rhodohalobacter mucosus]
MNGGTGELRNRGTEKRRNRETEEQRNGGTDEQRNGNTNNERRTANDEQLTTNNQQPTTNNQQTHFQFAFLIELTILKECSHEPKKIRHEKSNSILRHTVSALFLDSFCTGNPAFA